MPSRRSGLGFGVVDGLRWTVRVDGSAPGKVVEAVSRYVTFRDHGNLLRHRWRTERAWPGECGQDMPGGRTEVEETLEKDVTKSGHTIFIRIATISSL